MEKLRNLGITLLAFISTSLAFRQFLIIYHLENHLIATLFIGLVCFVLLLSRWLLLDLLLIFASYLACTYLFFPNNLPFSWEWLTNYWETLVNGYAFTQAGVINEFTVILTFSLVLSATMVLLILHLYCELYVFSYSLLLGYLLLAMLFNQGMDFTIPVLAIAFCGVVTFLLKQTRLANLQQVSLFFAATALSGCFLGAGYLLAQSPVRHSLVNLSGSFRNHLNELGIYENIRNANQNASRTGFSEDDTFLGGPVIDDNTVLFEAYQERGHYWRVESKNIYSGHGWSTVTDLGIENEIRETLEVSDPNYQGIYSDNEQIRLQLRMSENYVPLPYGQTSIDFLADTASFEMNPQTGRIYINGEGYDTRLNLTWSEATYSESELAAVPLVLPEGTSINYLQLPETLPQRVNDLALEITDGVTGLYNQVMAVEDYLSRSGNYRYSKIDAATVAENQDYVDQFLFESQVGYCNNFSSSMVVLLRTLGIPTRWVKGFAEGERRASISSDEYVYNVRNSDAHSWVEVYFEGYGWVPFEPTPSFSNPDGPIEETEESSTSESSSTETTESTSSANESSQSSSQDQSEAREPLISAAIWQQIYRVLRIIGAALAAIGLYLIYRNLLRIRIWWVLKTKQQPLIAAYPILLKALERHEFRQPSESLHSYAKRVEEKYPLEGSFAKLTKFYEEVLYNDAPEKSDRQLILHVTELIHKIKTRR